MTLESAQLIASDDGEGLLVEGLLELLGVCVLRDASARVKAQDQSAGKWGCLAPDSFGNG